ncbi:MAG: hypothetical protein EBU08_00345 [Micrococcales bacterium]|nr:hypothetical protein [Micrococcales bacterium]
MIDILEYLESKQVQIKGVTHDNTQVYMPCMFCGEDDDKRGRLYINVDPESDRWGAYFCFLCNTKGGINSLREFWGDPPLKDSHEFPQIMNVAAEFYASALYENPEAYEYLTHKRGLTEETIRNRKLGWAKGGLMTHLLSKGFEPEDIEQTGLINRFGTDFLLGHITIPYMDYGNVISIRGKKIGGGYLSLPGSKAALYGIDGIRGMQTVVLSAGEFDSLIMCQLGYSAVGVPGENIWKDGWTEELNDARRIFIVFDNDAAGRAGAEKRATELGPRARVVDMPLARPGQKKIDATEWVVKHGKGREDFDFLFSKAQGGLLISVAQAYERWTEIEGNPNLAGLRLNIPSIDNDMAHGILPGQVVVMIAKTNSGKTVSTLNLFHRMSMIRDDLKILYVSLEQTRNEWFERAHRIHNFYEPGVSTLDTVNYWRDRLMMVDKNRLTEDELVNCIDQYSYETGRNPDIVAVDYLGYYSRSFAGEEYARVTSAIMGLKAIAKERQIVIHVPHQVNRQGEAGQELKADQAKSSGAVEETADMLLALWNPDQRLGVMKEDQKKELLLKVQKSRDGAVGSLAQLQFAPLTLGIVPRGDPLYERAIRERQYWIAGDSWEKAVYRHRTGDESL